ncbi:LOW QUALITY PROTEIN: WASP homolog-associated protein with actin, membranes and microtubules [Tachyglossus aculeatus]|uniref:LOW QUALITY PROTEIN: WASP homolog-associated protein with actin, membranes and microtubules n=1 Tax=Tachyglossus aculeatus TaxID=9261 RepID=UPI0018F5F56A|nr:LOW QUALITY PROTEIN: WASP homolog-associated protein with actin, membranes and microtubules [Tachyglossus aculeatus]
MQGRLRQVLQAHTAAEMLVVYEEEDGVYQELVFEAADFYRYLLRPFRDTYLSYLFILFCECVWFCSLQVCLLEQLSILVTCIPLFLFPTDKMKNFSKQEGAVDAVDGLEIQYYEAQRELYEVRFEILKYEERLLILQLETVRRLLKEKQDEVVYYDTRENPEELKGLDQTVDQQDSQNPEQKKLHLQLRQLESQRGIICARRAYLRNKKDQCEENRQLKVRQAQGSHRHCLQHHNIQLKRDKKKQEEREKRKWINQEHQKTLQRLKTFKEVGAILCFPKNSRRWLGITKVKKFKRSARSGQKASSSDPGGPAPHLDVSPPTMSADAQPLSLIYLPPAPVKSKGQSGRGLMDEVLASLKQGDSGLCHVEQPHPPGLGISARDDHLAAIRRGVKLRRVTPGPTLEIKASNSELERSIKAAMRRIKKVSADSEEEDDGGEQNSGGEWDG